MSSPPVRPFVLIILDGFALREEKHGNAVAMAQMPNLSGWLTRYPVASLRSSGRAVGLPDDQMGNSEVGHQNIGAGRVVYQELTRIDLAVEDGSLARNPVVQRVFDAVKGTPGAKLHLLGLVSPGGVHSSQEHLHFLLGAAAAQGIRDVVVHAFLDGRDTPPQSARQYVARLEEKMRLSGVGRIGSVIGRYYAMDRDQRWDRVLRAWDCLVHGKSEFHAATAVQAIGAAYARGETDEFVLPTLIESPPHQTSRIEDGDVVFHFNFRPDRARQLTAAFTKDDFTAFERGTRPKLAMYSTLTQYEKGSSIPAAFVAESPVMTLGEVVSRAGLRQFRCAETEKYAHVTYFLNGGREIPFEGEDREMIPSPREVATYDLLPQMNAAKVARAVSARIASGKYALTVVNFANPDMVGHTGIIPAAVAAVEAVDRGLGEIVAAAQKVGAAVAITADHGNCEEMIAEDGTPHTAHTLRPVPFILIDDARLGVKLTDGALCNIAPTVLEIMGISPPPQMTASSLLAQ